MIGRYSWLWEYLRTARRRGLPKPGEPLEVWLCVADHFEPFLGGVGRETAYRRVKKWVDDYPRLFGHFRDSYGNPPKHTFFYPAEEYDFELMEMIADLCRAGYGEVEIHLHHDNDTPDNLRRTLVEFKQLLADKHGLLSRNAETGEVQYAFIHGNWALDNSHPQGRWCGVNNEIDILIETGCYADLTLPSYPSECQTRMINSLYWAVDDPRRPKSHDWGVRVGEGPRPAKSLLMIPGPLVLDWGRRKWGVLPRVENACLQGSQPPSARRLRSWLSAGIALPGRPETRLVKLHTHGCDERNWPSLLSGVTVELHETLARKGFRLLYCTPREVYAAVAAAAPVMTEKKFLPIGEKRLAARSPID